MKAETPGRVDMHLGRETAHESRGALNVVTVSADLLDLLASIAPGTAPTREARLRRAAAALGRRVREHGRLVEGALNDTQRPPEQDGRP